MIYVRLTSSSRNWDAEFPLLEALRTKPGVPRPAAFDRDFPDDSSRPPKTVAQSSIDRKRGRSLRFGGLGWATRRIRTRVKMHLGARYRSFGNGRAPGRRRFNPAAMTRGVMLVLASAAGRTLTLAEHIEVRRLTEASDTADLAIRGCRILAMSGHTARVY